MVRVELEGTGMGRVLGSGIAEQAGRLATTRGVFGDQRGVALAVAQREVALAGLFKRWAEMAGLERRAFGVGET